MPTHEIHKYLPRIVSRIVTSSSTSVFHPVIARAEISSALRRTPKNTVNSFELRKKCNILKSINYLLLEPGPYDRDSIARASSQLGSSWFDSIMSSTSSFTKLRFLSLKKDVAKPRLPIRPVRPIRCTYSSTSDGRSKLMTCFTLGISRPRAAT